MKKILSFLLTIVILLTNLCVYSSAAKADNFTYVVISETEKTCKIYSYSGTAKDVIVPEQVAGYTVVQLDSWTFYADTALTVHLPKTVHTLDGQSFNLINSTVHTITVAEDSPYFTSVDGVLFSKDKTKLAVYPSGKTATTYTIPEGVTEIGSHAFIYSTLEKVVFPSTMRIVGDNAFDPSYYLKSIEIPYGLTTIRNNAFSSCQILESIVLPDSVTTMEYNAFYHCPKLKSVTLSNSLETISTCSFMDCIFESIILPDSVKTLEDHAFDGCDYLTKIVIPTSVTSIGKFAFADSDNLTIYGYSNSYAETYAKEKSIPFVALENILSSMSSQIRFTANDDGSYANMFDIRTRAKISDEDFKTHIADTNEEAINKISKVGFVYTLGSNDFSADDARKVAQGEAVSGYTDAPVNYIQDADGYYMFTCLVTDIPTTDMQENLTAFAYICVNDTWYFFDAEVTANFNSLHSTYYPQAAKKYGWTV